MNEQRNAVVLAYSTSHALRVEKVLTESGITCKMIPVPRHISSDCGVCVRIASADQEAVLVALEAARVDIEGIHQV